MRKLACVVAFSAAAALSGCADSGASSGFDCGGDSMPCFLIGAVTLGVITAIAVNDGGSSYPR